MDMYTKNFLSLQVAKAQQMIVFTFHARKANLFQIQEHPSPLRKSILMKHCMHVLDFLHLLASGVKDDRCVSHSLPQSRD